MLVAVYDESDDRTEDEEYIDSAVWDDFKENIRYYLGERKFPLQLIALNSNWQGQTGYAEAESVDDIISKLGSFDSSYYELHKIGNSYEFRLATHDVPTGFTVQIRSL
jgi:hypothetical protein